MNGSRKQKEWLETSLIGPLKKCLKDNGKFVLLECYDMLNQYLILSLSLALSCFCTMVRNRTDGVCSGTPYSQMYVPRDSLLIISDMIHRWEVTSWKPPVCLNFSHIHTPILTRHTYLYPECYGRLCAVLDLLNSRIVRWSFSCTIIIV